MYVHIHLFQEDVRALDKITFSEWFEGKGGSRGSISRMWDPVAYALGFIDCDHISARCMLTIFQVTKIFCCILWRLGGGRKARKWGQYIYIMLSRSG